MLENNFSLFEKGKSLHSHWEGSDVFFMVTLEADNFYGLIKKAFFYHWHICDTSLMWNWASEDPSGHFHLFHQHYRCFFCSLVFSTVLENVILLPHFFKITLFARYMLFRCMLFLFYIIFGWNNPNLPLIHAFQIFTNFRLVLREK